MKGTKGIIGYVCPQSEKVKGGKWRKLGKYPIETKEFSF